MTIENKFIKWFDQISLSDLPLVGGKNASLGEMVSNMTQFGINVPFGFAITTEAYDTDRASNRFFRIAVPLSELVEEEVPLG